MTGDDVQLRNGTPTFADVEVGEGITINFTDFTISGTDADNYTLIQPTGVTAKIYNNYEAKVDVDYTVNSNDWQNTDFVVTAKDGYILSITDTNNGEWRKTLTATEETAEGQIKFYVRNERTKAILLL